MGNEKGMLFQPKRFSVLNKMGGSSWTVSK